MDRGWFMYIVSNNSHTLCTGISDNLPRRIEQHKNRSYENAFTARYSFDRLVWFEWQHTKSAAAKRERQIKNWRREKRVALIQAKNPNWIDLSLSITDALRMG